MTRILVSLICFLIGFQTSYAAEGFGNPFANQQLAGFQDDSAPDTLNGDMIEALQAIEPAAGDDLQPPKLQERNSENPFITRIRGSENRIRRYDAEPLN